MRGMLLCAGRGTRLAPHTDLLPKPLVPVLNRPLALYNLLLLRDAGVREVMINLHHHGALIPRVLGDGGDLGMQLHYSEETELLGTGGGGHAVRDFLSDGTCLVANGDSLCEADLGAVVERHRAREALATMVLHPHPSPEDFGAVRVGPDGGVVAIDHVVRRDDAIATGAHVYSGIQVLEPGFFEWLEPSPSCIVRTAWRRLIDASAPVFGDPAALRLHDCGTVDRLLAATTDLLHDPNAFAHVPRAPHHPDPGGSEEPPVLFGRDVEIGAGARIGPDVVLGDGVEVAPGARVARTVAWPGVTLEGSAQGLLVSR